MTEILEPLAMHKLDLGKRLGDGSFGNVFVARKTDTNLHVAVKLYKKSTHIEKYFRNERELLSKVKHYPEYFVEIIDSFEIPDKHAVIITNLLGEDLEHYLSRYPEGLFLCETKKILRSVLKALVHLKELHIVHCDLKLNNMMLPAGSHDLSKVKIIDFGLSKNAENIPGGTRCSILCYRAPEVLLELPISHPIDMWALGCIAYELHTGENLIDPHYSHQALTQIETAVGKIPIHMLLSSPKCQEYCHNPPGFDPKLRATEDYLKDNPRPNADSSLYDGNCLTHILTCGGDLNLSFYKPGKEELHFYTLLRNMMELYPYSRADPSEGLRHSFFL